MLTQVPTWILKDLQDAASQQPRPPSSGLRLIIPPSDPTASPSKSKLKNFAVTPDLQTPKLPSSPGGVSSPLTPTLPAIPLSLGTTAATHSSKKKQFPSHHPRALKSAASANSLISHLGPPGQGDSAPPGKGNPAPLAKGRPRINPLNMKKAQSQADLGRGADKTPTLPKQRSLTQVKSQLARVSVTSKDSWLHGSVESVQDGSVGSHSGSSSPVTPSPLVQRRRMSLPSQPPLLAQGDTAMKGQKVNSGSTLPKLAVRGQEMSSEPPLPKLAVRGHHKVLVSADAESAAVVHPKSEREEELEGEIEKLKGDLAKVSTCAGRTMHVCWW